MEQNKNYGFFSNFISRPVLALVINIIITLVGIVAWNQLKTRDLPKITYPTIRVRTEFAGAGPELVESQITIPLEEALAGIEGLDYISSTSTNGQSEIQLYFVSSKNIDAASADVRDRISKAKDSFPQGLRDPEMIKSGSSNTSAGLRAVAYSSKYTVSEISDLISKTAKSEIETIEGVAAVHITGAGAGAGGDSGSFQIYITISPEKLKAYNLTLYEVREAVYQQCFKKPLGEITQRNVEYSIAIDNAPKNYKDYGEIILKTHNNCFVKLKDVATIEVQKEDADYKIRYKGLPCVEIDVVLQQEANPIETIKNVNKKIAIVKKSLPKGIVLEVADDKSEMIKKSLHSVYKTIIEAILFVLVVMLLFLRSWRSAFIPMITIPICIFGSFFIIYMFGYTINTLTLLALVLAIGLVVDDAIVVLENIYRHIEEGLSPIAASLKGLYEIQFSIVAMTVTLMAVYAPIALTSGLIGKLFIEFAVTLAGAVLISGIVALVLTPMLCSKILKHEKQEQEWQKIVSKTLDKIDEKYKNSLAFALKNKFFTLIICIIFGLAGLGTAKFYLKQVLMPEIDNSTIILQFDAPSGANSQYYDQYATKIEEAIKDIPEIKNYLVSISRSYGKYVYIQLVSPEKRKKSAKQVLEYITTKIDPVQSGISVMGYCDSGALGGDDEGTNKVHFAIQSNKSYDEIEEIANQFIRTINTSAGCNGNTMRSSRVSPEKSYKINFNKEKAALLGLRLQDIAEMLSIVMRGQPPIDRFEKDGKRYPVKLIFSDEFKKNPENLKRVHMRSIKTTDQEKGAPLIALGEIIEIKETKERPLAKRIEGMRAYEIIFEVNKGYSVMEVYKQSAKILDATLPQGYKYTPVGELRKAINESSSIVMIFLLALLFIFLIMAAQFESFIDPFMIILTVPLALAGGVLTLALVPGSSLNIYTYIALVTLIGLITKHGILIVDFANKILDTKTLTLKNIEIAIKEAALIRLRPILMTTAAMVLGAIPLALATGARYEIRSQIGWVIVGGMSFGTLFTIFLVPCVYVIIKSIMVNETKLKSIEE